MWPTQHQTYFGLHGRGPLRPELQDHLQDAEVCCDLLQDKQGGETL